MQLAPGLGLDLGFSDQSGHSGLVYRMFIHTITMVTFVLLCNIKHVYINIYIYISHFTNRFYLEFLNVLYYNNSVSRNVSMATPVARFLHNWPISPNCQKIGWGDKIWGQNCGFQTFKFYRLIG